MKKIIVMLAAAMLTASCTISRNDLYVNTIKDIETQNASFTTMKIGMKADIGNNSSYRVKVVEGSMVLSNTNGRICEITLQDGFILHKKSVSEVSLPLVVRYDNMLSLLAAMNGDVGSNTKVTWSVHAKWGPFSRKFSEQDVPLEYFIKSLNSEGLNIKQ